MRPILVIWLGALLAAGCGGEPGTGVTMVTDPTRGGVWWASGDAVDGAVMCPGGSRRTIEPFDTGTSDDGDAVLVVEWACADGSGAFTVIEERIDGGTWRVSGGRGASSGLTGGGTLTLITSGSSTSQLRFSGDVELVD